MTLDIVASCRDSLPMLYTHHASPLGPLLLVGNGEGLRGLYMDQHRHGPSAGSDWIVDERPFVDARRQLDAYFAGTLREFSLLLAAQGTPFQLSVWAELARIPYGETRSYGEVARRIGNPRAVRAVGAANGRNPISIIVPCHRVLGADGSLTGFGGGEQRKRWLLDLERRDRRLL